MMSYKFQNYKINIEIISVSFLGNLLLAFTNYVLLGRGEIEVYEIKRKLGICLCAHMHLLTNVDKRTPPWNFSSVWLFYHVDTYMCMHV